MGRLGCTSVGDHMEDSSHYLRCPALCAAVQKSSLKTRWYRKAIELHGPPVPATAGIVARMTMIYNHNETRCAGHKFPALVLSEDGLFLQRSAGS